MKTAALYLLAIATVVTFYVIAAGIIMAELDTATLRP